MLFGRAPQKESVTLPELEAYIGRCFDGKLRRLSGRLQDMESGLSASFADFEKAVLEFSKSKAPPDMDYLYGVKEGFMGSQKANYSSSVLHLLAAPPKHLGEGAYQRAKEILEAYSSFTTYVLKTNNTFKFVMVGYAKDLSNVKRHFTSMERLCNELRNELALCAPEETEYRKLISRASEMLGLEAEILELRKPPGTARGSAPALLVEAEMRKQLEEAQARLEMARRGHREASSVLANLLLPVERAARKHDHLSAARRKLGDYMGDPSENIMTPEDGKLIHDHLLKVAEEIREGKIEAKNPEGLISQIEAIRSSDLLALAASGRGAAAELKRAEADLDELHIRIKSLEKVKEEAKRSEAERATNEHQIEAKQARLLSEKRELEGLLLSCYKKNAEIKVS